MSALKDFLGFVVNPPPGDTTRTAGSDQIVTTGPQVQAPTGDATTDTGNILAAVSRAGAGTTVELSAGTYALDARRIVVPDVVALSGTVASHQAAGTTLQCNDPAAGVTFNGRGGPNIGVRVNGNGLATQPWIVNAGLDRTFVNWSAANSAQDGLVINSLQNSNFIGCGFDGSARDNLVVDLGAGGFTFDRCEFNAPGRYNVHVQQSGASPSNAYPTFYGPGHIKWDHCEIERTATDNPCVYIERGSHFTFDACGFARNIAACTTPLFLVADYAGGGNWPTYVQLDRCTWFGGDDLGAVYTPACIKPGAGQQRLVITGMHLVQCGSPFIDGSSPTAIVHVQQQPYFLGSSTHAAGPMFTASTPLDGSNTVYWYSEVNLDFRRATTSPVLRSEVSGDSAYRLRISGDGSYAIGSGSTAPDTSFQRGGAGAFQINNVLQPVWTGANQAGGTNYSINAAAGQYNRIKVNDTTAFTINAPTNTPVVGATSYSQDLTVEVFNSSGGVMGAITWPAVMNPANQGFTWTNPANGKRRSAHFRWNAVNWVCIGVSQADYS